MLQETGEIRNLIWLSKLSRPGGPKKVKGGRVSLTPFLSLAFVSLYTSSHTHSHRADAHKYTQTCVLYSQTG